MAGLACAGALHAAGAAMTVFDKGRGAGGRLATRWVEDAYTSGRALAEQLHLTRTALA